jgi:hypothetical protein
VVDDVAPVNEGDFAFSGEAAPPGGVVVGVVVAAGSVEVNIDFTGVVAGGADGVPPKTVVPVPLLIVSPPVFHAGTESGLFEAA